MFVDHGKYQLYLFDLEIGQIRKMNNKKMNKSDELSFATKYAMTSFV